MNQNIIEKQQVRGTSASIAQYAGKEGQIVFNKDNKRLHVMSGTAGQSTQYLSTAQAATKTQLSAKLDASTYNSDKANFATKSQIPDTSTLATKSEVTSGLANKVDTSTYTADKATFALKTEIPDTSGLATKTQLSGYATTTALTQGLAGKANETHTHEIANVNGLQTVLDNKQPVGSYAASSHTHAIANVTDLQTTLDGKIPKTGSTGSITTTETITAGGSAFTVGPNQPQSYSASDGATITVQDGTQTEGWITTVALAGSATVNFGSNWAYVGSAPTLAKGLLTFAWRGAFGVIQFSKFGE